MTQHLPPRHCRQRNRKFFPCDLRLICSLTLAVLAVGLLPAKCDAEEVGLDGLNGDWLYVEDKTPGRAVEQQGPPMSALFKLRVEEDAVIHVRPRGDERITLDGSVIEVENDNGSSSRYSGLWKDGELRFTVETIRTSDNQSVLKIERTFRVTDEGMRLSVSLNGGASSVARYQHPDKIELPVAAKATIEGVAWLEGAWVGTRRTSSIEERWGPPLGGAMLGVSRTVRADKMVAFEYLRVVERDGGLVYVAQPGGKTATEFVLTKLEPRHAVFVNPRHDFPQRIEYQLSEDGSLTASIGFAKGGTPRKFEFKTEGN